MNKIKKYLKEIKKCIISILIFSFIVSTLYYFIILGNTLVTYLGILIVILNIFISSYNLGKKSSENGYLEGLNFSSLIILLLFLITSVFFRDYISLRLFIYYIIIISLSVFASMLGISKKKS